jgi:DNA (cytosine-5)-methyltransferase 1
MSKELLIREVPPRVAQWITQERQQNGVSQNQLLLRILDRAVEGEFTPGLFEQKFFRLPEANPDRLPFTFIDLFAGIGGFRLGLEKAGGRCLFTSEWDEHSQKTYRAWFGEWPQGDIRTIKPAEIPNHDILAAGFPCQPFSLAGVSKKNSLGQAHGFKCNTQGTLFYNIASIIEVKRPPVVMLENVKNLLSHDRGKTWSVIKSTIEDLRYSVFHKVIDAAAYVPQHRERVFVVCLDRDVFGANPPFEFPQEPPKPRPVLKEILESTTSANYTLSDHLWHYLQEYARRHKEKGNGFGFGIADPNGVSRTLSARYYKDGSEILIAQEQNNPRRLTPREAARLMGFPEQLPIVVSDTQAYRQFGNALCPPVAEAVAKQVVKVMAWKLSQNGCLLKKSFEGNGTGHRNGNGK